MRSFVVSSMSLKYPSAAGADPEALAQALMRRQVSPRKEAPLADYEALQQACERAEGEERERLRSGLFQMAGLPVCT